MGALGSKLSPLIVWYTACSPLRIYIILGNVNPVYMIFYIGKCDDSLITVYDFLVQINLMHVGKLHKIFQPHYV